jgi:predicted O-methyltransferase YrrM
MSERFAIVREKAMEVTVRSVEDYINHRSSSEARTVSELYGTESFCYFLYSLIKMDRPSVVIELGCGGAATTLMAARALSENGHGHLWTIDNGSDWTSDLVRETCLDAFGGNERVESYTDFIGKLVERFSLSEQVTLVDMTLNGIEFFDPGRRIDMVFSDATPSHPEGCLSLLKYYLPRVNPYSSIFIDRAGTINHAWLLLRFLVDRLQAGKIPWHLIDGSTVEEQNAVEKLARTCEFQLINLTETRHNKQNKTQNSRAWIKIQPNDYVPHNEVLTFGSITSPWELR